MKDRREKRISPAPQEEKQVRRDRLQACCDWIAGLSRKRRLFLSSSISFAYQITAFVCGFILPRLILSYYGSEVNGLVTSITNFLGFITLAECGVGAVVLSAYYKPLAEHDDVEISKVFASSEKFFHTIALILVVYTACLFFAYPLLVADSFDFLYTAILILVMSISYFAQYYIGMSYKLLLNADQLYFIQYGTALLTLIVNTVVSVILICSGCSIHAVKLFSSVIHLVQPLVFKFIVSRNYHVDRTIRLTEEPIKQKWNGMAQHIAFVVLGNTDTVLLTLFSTLSNVSIYNVYFLVVNGLRQLFFSVTNGFTPLFGSMIAKEEKREMDEVFGMVEWAMHTGSTLIFTMCGILIVPFIMVYTKGVNDANYNVPLFAALLTLSQFIRCLQLPYNTLIHAAGHFKQTQTSSIIEAALNIVVSILLVFHFGLNGVALGTAIAVFYRALYLTWYLKRNIIRRKMSHFFGHLAVDVLTTVLVVLAARAIPFQVENYLDWILAALVYGAICVAIMAVINLLIYRKEIQLCVRSLKK